MVYSLWKVNVRGLSAAGKIVKKTGDMMSSESEQKNQTRKSVMGLVILLIAGLAALGGVVFLLSDRRPPGVTMDSYDREGEYSGQEKAGKAGAGDSGQQNVQSGGEDVNSEASGQAAWEQSALAQSERTESGQADTGQADIGETEHKGEGTALTPEQQALLAEADRLAAGYDYDGAMSLIESCESFSEIPQMAEALVRYENEKAATVRYSSITQITHVFYHSLIVDTSLAFDGDEDAASYNRVMTTVEEFQKIMEEMYNRGYVLVSMHDMAHIEVQADGTEVMVAGDIYLPPGKIPYVLSLDDMSYYHYMEGDGFADRVILDENGKVTCEYTQADGTVITGAFDVVPLVDAFVEEHPDGAYRGARGVVALTGYNGVLGYRTDPAYQTGSGLDASQWAWLSAHPDFNYERECADARAVAEAMRANGWEFACHSYGHLNFKTASYEDFVWDVNTWKNTVEPIVGETDIVIYAFGADISDWHPYTAENEKYRYLKNMGFDYFCNVDSSQYWVQLGSDFLRQGRRNLDGIRMWEAISGGTDRVSDLFDAASVFDTDRPTPVR